MRKRTLRNGLRLVLVALLLIILVSFFHEGVADLFLLVPGEEFRFYSNGIFWAAAIGAYGVVLSVFGLILQPDARDAGIRILPLFLFIIAAIAVFFFLSASSLSEPSGSPRLRPGETITI